MSTTRPGTTGRKPRPTPSESARRSGPPTEASCAEEASASYADSPRFPLPEAPNSRTAAGVFDPEFCLTHRISVPFYFQLKAQGLGPREMKLGARRIISAEAATKSALRRPPNGALDTPIALTPTQLETAEPSAEPAEQRAYRELTKQKGKEVTQSGDIIALTQSYKDCRDGMHYWFVCPEGWTKDQGVPRGVKVHGPFKNEAQVRESQKSQLNVKSTKTVPWDSIKQ